MDELELLLNTFRRESEEMFDHLAQLIENLASKSEKEQKEGLAEAIRMAHNIKGAASTVGLESIASPDWRRECAKQSVSCLMELGVTVIGLSVG